MAEATFRARRRLVGALITAAIALPFASAPAGAQEEPAEEKATLTGVVTNDTKGAPAAGVDVTLHILQGEAELTTVEAKTDAAGRYSFSKLDTAEGRTFAVTADFLSVTYQSETTTLASGETKELAVSIYETTEAKDNIAIKDWVVWIDREGEGAAVQHDVTILNAGTTSYVGDEPLDKGKRAVISLAIPVGARDFQYLGQFMECCAVVRGTTFLHTAALRPGEVRATVRTSTGSLSELSLSAPLPTDTLRVFVPSDLDVTPSAGLKAAGQLEDMGVSYQTFTATGLSPGDEVSLEVSGLSSKSSNQGLLLGLIAAVVLLGAGVFVAVRRLRAGSGRGKAPAPTAESAAPTAPAPDHTPASVIDPSDPLAQAEADLIIEEIAALDLAFERGAMAEETHRRVREARLARLLELRGVSEVNAE